MCLPESILGYGRVEAQIAVDKTALWDVGLKRPLNSGPNGQGMDGQRRWFLAAQFQPLIHGQRQDSKHQMSHDLGCSAIVDVTRSKVIFQP